MDSLLEINKHGVLAPKSGLSIDIPIITPDAGMDVWAQIEGLVRDYAYLNPLEMRQTLYTNKWHRTTLKNSLGASEQKSMRWSMAIPPGLDVLIKRYFPGFFDGKKGKHNMNKFMKRFPGFRVCERI